MANYIGEIISLGVACSWTVAALSSEVGSRRLGVFVMNVWRMSLALLFSVGLMWLTMGVPFPQYAGAEAWSWLLLSGVVGYFFGGVPFVQEHFSTIVLGIIFISVLPVDK